MTSWLIIYCFLPIKASIVSKNIIKFCYPYHTRKMFIVHVYQFSFGAMKYLGNDVQATRSIHSAFKSSIDAIDWFCDHSLCAQLELFTLKLNWESQLYQNHVRDPLESRSIYQCRLARLRIWQFMLYLQGLKRKATMTFIKF